jgi:hypothetical protein
MIMNYKQEEEERYAEKANIFEPTGLSDPIKTYELIEYGSTGVLESRILQRQTIAIEKQYDEKVAELTKLQNV